MFEASGRPQAAVFQRSDIAPAFDLLGDLSAHKLWQVLWQGKTTILVSVVTALVAAVLFAAIVPYRYVATTQILIEPANPAIAQRDGALPVSQSDPVIEAESQARVIGSDNVLRHVVSVERLDQDPEFARGALSQEDGSLAALDALRHHLELRRPERTHVVELTVTSGDPIKAARIANAIAQAYLAVQRQLRADASRQISPSLSGRSQELEDRLGAAQDKLEAYKASRNIVEVNGALIDQQQISNLDSQIDATRARTAAAKTRLDQIESVQRSRTAIDAFPDAVQSKTIAALRGQYNDVMRREAEQKISLGERHPAIIEIEAEARRLQKLIDDEVNRLAQSARAEYDSAKANEGLISRDLAAFMQNAAPTGESLTHVRELEGEVEKNRVAYEASLPRGLGGQEQNETATSRVLSEAEPPLQRTWPPSNLVIALGAMMFGAACGIGIVVARWSYADFEPRWRAGYAPGERDAAARRSRSSFLTVASTGLTIPVLAQLPAADIWFGLTAVSDPYSRFARQIRDVYEAVCTSHTGRGNPSVLIVAGDDEDDTAAVAPALAAATAATQRVLLIDADLKRRTLSAINADRSDAGLADVAAGRRALSDVVVHDRDTNINLMPFVAPNSRRDRPIRDADVAWAFDKTRRFDMVIVAAVGLGRGSSARFFAGLVDHIVLVARPDEKHKHAVAQFISRLGPDAAKVRGAVLTGLG
jgi:uncharacterized protein involved in exopolysaccharide biosynthesis/Mrp family chromosome partitioning ATPase